MHWQKCGDYLCVKVTRKQELLQLITIHPGGLDFLENQFPPPLSLCEDYFSGGEKGEVKVLLMIERGVLITDMAI